MNTHVPQGAQSFRKKPIVIQAWQFDPLKPATDAPSWISFKWFFSETDLDENGREQRGDMIMCIPTLEGVMTARAGDWIIRGVKGEVYPCKPDIFEATYDAA